ncbi:MAG: UvrD-helicase domain-containing protein [Verrucomicrobia bacterium]|nr:UvrD-helicase domain-containing protein [Verrucomicrobiota bacterium]
MNEPLIDRPARERFRTEWDGNFAVSANAGSGKTTAISERLAAIALAPDGADRLRKTAVVTYTKKAAAQIGQRARQVLLRRVSESGTRELAPLDRLERAFFGTIHSFCLKLAQTYGQTVGINLNPTVITENDEALWEEFLEQDPMQFDALAAAELTAFLRHVALEEIFPLARELDAATAAALRRRRPAGPLPAPAVAAGEELLALVAKGAGAKNILLSQARARAWQEGWARGAGFLPLYEPAGSAQAVVAGAREWMAPLTRWLAAAAAALAGELAERYRAWRFARGVQTYPDQIDAAMAVLGDEALLNRIRAEGWRIILDEAQDTDPQQFAVLIELARPPGAKRGTWPAAGGPGPRPGHFCMVGDGQQAIYSSRADIGNFSQHADAFRRGDGGELLEFQVTFRAPHALIAVLNSTLPAAFGPDRPHNFGLPPAEGAAPPPFLQVPYVPLEPGPENVAGDVRRLALAVPAPPPEGVGAWLENEARQVAAWLHLHGPAGVGARSWGEIAVLAPRNEWLLVAHKAFERAGLEVALQTRRTRGGDNPAYAWLTGLLAVVADPEDMFEWAGVLREIFAVSDGLIAAELRAHGRLAWEEPGVHPEPLRGALAAVRPFVLRANDPGETLDAFARELADTCALADKTWRLDPSGGMAAELARLLAEAAELGLAGGSPRAWLDELRRGSDDGRPTGKPSAGAINLLTSHSAKGLEWPVVIVLGLWRGIGQAPDRGLKLVRDAAAGPRVFFDAASLPADTREARDRERVRELTRLLYVTLTRARRVLVVPWADGFGGRQREKPSFAELWAADLPALPGLDGLPPMEVVGAAEEVEAVSPATGPEATAEAMPPLPARLLPHQLAHHRDLARMARHESAVDAPLPARNSDEAIDYGLWWHETMEFLPWGGDDAAVVAHGKKALAAAEAPGFRPRGELEWARLRASDAWAELRAPRWTRLAELGIFAPLHAGAWIDGVVDLVLHDAAAKELWIIDWKTNRRHADEGDDALLVRLVEEYTPQLVAYARCAAEFFPGAAVKAFVFSSAAGKWREVLAACRTCG